MKVAWFSGGVSSFVAIYLERKTIDKLLYIHIDDQHFDTFRFLNECKAVLNKDIEILQSRYKTVDSVQKQTRAIAFIHGAPCTDILKKRVRKEWEYKHKGQDITYFWGMDFKEQHRAERLVEGLADFKHRFPLIEKQIIKQEAHGILARIGIKRPAMYDMGYQNNNCIGCVKGGMWYWNKIRVDFPEVFELRAKREREINNTSLHDKNGKIFLDELNSTKGRKSDEIKRDCNIFCQLNWEENNYE